MKWLHGHDGMPGGLFSEVKQMMPYLHSDSCVEIALSQLSPFSISSGEKNTSTDCIMHGIHFFNNSAILRLKSPDQLTKTFYQLILAINNTLEVSLEDKILENAFDAMWPALEIEINHILNQFAQKNTKQKKGMNLEQPENAPIEEILQLLRKQNSVLSSPENLLPIDYMERIQSQLFERRQALYVEDDMLLEELVEYFREVLSRLRRCSGDVRRDVIDVLILSSSDTSRVLLIAKIS